MSSSINHKIHHWISLILFITIAAIPPTSSFTSTPHFISSKIAKTSTRHFSRAEVEESSPTPEPSNDKTRRNLLKSTLTHTTFGAISLLLSPEKSLALSAKSRTDGYPLQKTEQEWSSTLSGIQNYILREGGTESPNSSVLEGEERKGVYQCAGCGTELFKSKDKFHSGTGWPSFANGSKDVEVENVNPVMANLGGAELRCRNCGGHLGDVFNDGFLFVGTPAFLSGKRLCIDGGALVFRPEGENEGVYVSGDVAPKKSGGGLERFFEPPKIQSREK